MHTDDPAARIQEVRVERAGILVSGVDVPRILPPEPARLLFRAEKDRGAGGKAEIAELHPVQVRLSFLPEEASQETVAQILESHVTPRRGIERSRLPVLERACQLKVLQLQAGGRQSAPHLRLEAAAAAKAARFEDRLTVADLELELARIPAQAALGQGLHLGTRVPGGSRAFRARCHAELASSSTWSRSCPMAGPQHPPCHP